MHYQNRQEKRKVRKIEQICLWNPMTIRFIMLTLIYVICATESQTFLLAKRPQRRGARRNGCSGCFRRLPFSSIRN